MSSQKILQDIKKIYLKKKPEIKSRLKEFSRFWADKNDEKIFAELTFCLLTPQSKARTCWTAVSSMIKKGILFNGRISSIRHEIRSVRFKNKKAEYIFQARKTFTGSGGVSISKSIGCFKDIYKSRDWLVKNIKGIGYKEASHFLRNIGLGEGLAILDRHILKNLNLFKVINDIPEFVSRKKYLEIEDKMAGFSKKAGIPMGELDLLLWCRQTGEVFK